MVFGCFFVLWGALTYAAYLVGNGRPIPKFGAMRFTCWAMIFSTVCVLLHALVASGGLNPDLPLPLYQWKAGAAHFALIGSLGPVPTLLLDYPILGENCPLGNCSVCWWSF